jgi:hypothetical protein
MRERKKPLGGPLVSIRPPGGEGPVDFRSRTWTARKTGLASKLEEEDRGGSNAHEHIRKENAKKQTSNLKPAGPCHKS